MTSTALKSLTAACALSAALLSTPIAQAEASRRRPPRPPAEAFEAYQGKSEGSACEVDFHGDILDGVCIAPNDEELFCMPSDMPPPPDGERPPER